MNAIDAAPDGSHVHLTARPADDGVELRVSDQGPGIPSKEQARLFHRFQQLDSSAARKAGGTGLGLANALRLAEELGGGLSLADAATDGGAHFVLRLPAAGDGAASETRRTSRPA